jgi:hypothetical protein
MELDQIAEIFERINSMGKKLSKWNIELKKLWEEVARRYSPKFERYDKVTEKMPVYVLQAVSLYYNKANACSRQDILNIYQNIFEPTGISFDKVWHDISDYTYRGISKLENLRDGFGVKDENQLPFSPMIPILAASIKEIETRDNKADCYKELAIWYWSSVFSNAYSGAVDSQLTADFRELKEWFSNKEKIPKTVDRFRKEFETLDIQQVQSKGSAMYRGVLSLLALNGSKDFDTGQTLENARGNDKDYIFPRAEFGSQRYINSILNITWMSDETNRKIKGFEKPSKYVQESKDEKYNGNKDEFLKVLETHFINETALEYMMKDDFESFIEERQKLISGKIRELVGIEGIEVEGIDEKTGLISPEKPFSNKLKIWNTIKSCSDYLYWIDKYFSAEGFELLHRSLNKSKVKTIKILTSIVKTDSKFRDEFKAFREEMKNNQIECELRVITDHDLSSNIHDRWIISNNCCFNIPSPDVIATGQFSEIKNTENRLPFEEWWHNSCDIISQWNEIEKVRTSIHH